MNLVLDIGNTRSKLGLFSGSNLLEKTVWTNWTTDELIAFGNHKGVQCIMLSSVAKPVAELLDLLRPYFTVLELTHDTPLPFVNAYGTPQTLGKDRLAAVAGAHALYGGENCLVVDCGTCIKYDLMRATGEYIGGNIAPGARMRIQAMHHFTARLPEVAQKMPANFWGHSTETALQNGALRGAALEIEGFYRVFAARFASLHLIMTGGDAEFFRANLSIHPIILEPDLTLIGLNHILEYQNV
jgi:type III pantothenate kinase